MTYADADTRTKHSHDLLETAQSVIRSAREAAAEDSDDDDTDGEHGATGYVDMVDADFEALLRSPERGGTRVHQPAAPRVGGGAREPHGDDGDGCAGSDGSVAGNREREALFAPTPARGRRPVPERGYWPQHRPLFVTGGTVASDWRVRQQRGTRQWTT